MYKKNAMLFDDYFVLTENLSNAIDHINATINRLRKGDFSKVGVHEGKKIIKEISNYSAPIKQVFGEQTYRDMIKLVASSTNIKQQLKSGTVTESNETSKSIADEIKDIMNGNYSWFDKVKLIVAAFAERFGRILNKAADKLSNYTADGSRRFKTSIENYLDKFFDKLNENNILKKHKNIVTNIMFIVCLGLGLAITNIGVRMAGSDLNQVKSFTDFFRIIASSITKNPISFILIVIGLIIFLYSLYVILRKSIVFILDKLHAFISKRISSIRSNVKERIETNAEQNNQTNKTN